CFSLIESARSPEPPEHPQTRMVNTSTARWVSVRIKFLLLCLFVFESGDIFYQSVNIIGFCSVVYPANTLFPVDEYKRATMNKTIMLRVVFKSSDEITLFGHHVNAILASGKEVPALA